MGSLSRARGKSFTAFGTGSSSASVSTVSSDRTSVRGCSRPVEGARTGSVGASGGDGGSGNLVGSASSQSGGSRESTGLFSAASFARDARSLSSRLSLRLPVEYMTGSSSREGDCVRGGWILEEALCDAIDLRRLDSADSARWDVAERVTERRGELSGLEATSNDERGEVEEPFSDWAAVEIAATKLENISAPPRGQSPKMDPIDKQSSLLPPLLLPCSRS